MAELHFPWIHASIVVPLLGGLWMTATGTSNKALRTATVACAVTLLLTLGQLIDFVSLGAFEAHDRWPALRSVFSRNVFVVDELSTALLPLAALVFLVTIMSTLRTKIGSFSLASALYSESLLLALFSCRASWLLVILLVLSTIPPYLELRQRRRCTRIYVWHMSLFAGLLVVGWGWLQVVDVQSPLAAMPILLLAAAGLLRSGIFPLHLWMTDLFEKAFMGTAIVSATPLIGAYIVMRLVLPTAPDSVLQGIVIVSLATAVYAGGMALVQREARRMFCFVLLSQASLVLVGLAMVAPIGLTGALCLWISVGLSLTGFGITLRSIEARIARISLAEFHGLYTQMPMLTGFFLLTGLASIGFPATIGFVGMELLIDGAVEFYPLVGTLVVIAAAFNGIAVLMAYFRIFTGRRYPTSIPMRTRPRESIAVLTLSLLILGGGLWPQPNIASRYHAAKKLTEQRDLSIPESRSDGTH
ncbi:MAG: proton-conducting transporter transmembrane domain-containing protein [Aureliella sp.]